jgi:PEP-CTERM motif
MIKKLTLALGCLALIASLHTSARADAITFSFVGGPLVNIDSTGLTAGPSLVLLISDTKLGSVFSFAGTASVSTGAATSYTATATSLSAVYGAGGSVMVTSAAACGGVCLTGNLNANGAYAATTNQTGSFQGLFNVTYVNPAIPAMFAEPNAFLPVGSDSLNTGFNMFASGGTTATATLLAGQISFQTPVIPEPGTLALFGTGILGLAEFVRRKKRN